MGNVTGRRLRERVRVIAGAGVGARRHYWRRTRSATLLKKSAGGCEAALREKDAKCNIAGKGCSGAALLEKNASLHYAKDENSHA